MTTLDELAGRTRLVILAVVLCAAGVIGQPGLVRAQDADEAAAPALIGDSARELLFTPVPRCRVIDTRVAGGRLSAGIPRDFDVAGTLVGQGGAADCLVPKGPATVVVLNLTVVQPVGAGTVAAWPFGGTAPTAATLLSFNPRGRSGVNANEVFLPICDAAVSNCTRDLVVQANGSDTHLVADVAGYFSKVTGVTVPWSAVTGKPAGFADDTDNDTQYTAGTGLIRSGTQFSVDTSAIQARVAQTCAAGSSIRVIQANGQVTCETDDDTNTTYTAGAGLNLGGTVFSVPNLGITGSMLAAGAVGAGKIAANAVTGAEIADRTVNTADIAVGAITSAELASFAVGANKIGAGVVGQSEIATDGVGAAEITANAVGSEEIASGAVGRSEIDGAERAFYRTRPACHTAEFTTSSTCTTPLCTPVPIPLFWSCGNNCDSFTPVECDNTLLGYLLSPTIE